jgi:hypothetical protein
MLLTSTRLVGIGPFDDALLRFADEAGAPRPMTVVLGAGGVGKTALLAAIASTRPGYAIAQRARGEHEAAFVVTEWMLGADDPARPHVLRVASPNTNGFDYARAGARDVPSPETREDEASLRRREQALFDRRASEAGFPLVSISGARWFSRAPVLLAGERASLRWDVRAPASFDDPTKADLARETKQCLSFASVSSALAPSDLVTRPRALKDAMHGAIGAIEPLTGCSFIGADPTMLEPMFALQDLGTTALFDELPQHARHLVAIVALTLRAIYAARPDDDPRTAEAVVLVDDIDSHQDPSVQRAIPAALRASLPGVQWIVTTSSPAVAMGCAQGEVIALRRLPGSARIEVHDGELAQLH